MQPDDRMKPSDDELISRIRAGLQDYEEPYVAGTWENFNQRQKSKKGSTFRGRAWRSAAAVLLVGVAFLIHFNSTVDKESVQPAKINKSTQPAKIGNQATDDGLSGNSPETLINKKEMNVASNILPKQYDLSRSDIDVSIKQNTLSMKAIEPFVTSGTDFTAQAGFAAETLPVLFDSPAFATNPVTGKIDSADSKISFENFLATEISSANQEAKKASTGEEDRKWNMGLVVSPSYGNSKKLTMGYGLSLAYALSDKLSLGSGISLNQISAEKDFVQPETMVLLNGKVLESAESNLTGIDIPLDVKYHISKNLYANVGISAFAVLDQSSRNTFVEAKLIERSYNTAEGKEETRTLVESQRTVEKVPDADLGNSKYSGLYNFSFGFKQQVSKNTSLSVEPFVKVPVRENTKGSIKLFGTGLRLKLEI